MPAIHRFAAAAVAVALCAAAPATAQTSSRTHDARTPDVVEPVTPMVDLRSPDARLGEPAREQAPAPARVRIVEVPSNGFEWGDAGIGAAGMLALVLVGVGIAMAGVRHRGRRLTA